MEFKYENTAVLINWVHFGLEVRTSLKSLSKRKHSRPTSSVFTGDDTLKNYIFFGHSQ